MKGKSALKKIILITVMVAILGGLLTACQLQEPSNDTLFYINESQNAKNLHDTDKDGAIDNVTGGIENLREYVKDSSIATTGYYMGVNFNVTTYKRPNNTPSAFSLNVKAHLYTNAYYDDDGHRTYQFKRVQGTYESAKYNAYYYNLDLRKYMYYDDLFAKAPTTVAGGVIEQGLPSNWYDDTVIIGVAEFVLGRDYFDTSSKTAYKKVNPQTDDNNNVIVYYKETATGLYVDVSTVEGKTFVDSEIIHNEVIKKSDITIEWIDQSSNEVLIGMYFDGINNNSEDNGNILYLDIQGYKRSFINFGDTVLYQQMIRLLMSLSVESLLTGANLQGDAGTSSLKTLFDVAVTDNYKVVYNGGVTSTLFYGVSADVLANQMTEVIQDLFAPFQNKIDPLTLRYLGFKFSVMGVAIINSISSDMQFFTQTPDEDDNAAKILTGAYLTFSGAAASGSGLYSYDADASFDYGAYPPEPILVENKDYYNPYDYGNYEFVGNLYIPMIDSNFDALIRTDMQQYDNAANNVFMEFRDIANGELMIGAYYKNERTYLDIAGMEYLYGAIALEELGFPKVYDERINLADALGKFFNIINNGIVSIVDGILSPDKSDKENKLLQYIMDKTFSTEKDPNDPFTKNTVTLTVDMELIKNALRETGVGEFSTRDIINILDSMSPYTMDQIATILGVSSAEIMLDNTYFTLTIIINDKGRVNDFSLKMYTNVGIKEGDASTLLFQLDLTPTHLGEEVKISEIDFTNFKPLEQIYTYSATMGGNFIFSTAEVVDLSKLLSSTIGENSGLNTQYILPSTAGISFDLIYDQYVLDQTVEGVLKKAGRSAFTLSVYLTGDEGTIIIELSSDDVAFNNQVYQGLPGTADQLGYVWVNIACIFEGKERKIPKIKVREDIFMASMQSYMQGTAISDDVSNLGASDINLSITSILMALVKDSYVVLQPEQIEITTSNETVQNLFRVDSLIGNIRFDAGFRYRVKGLESVKADYGLYSVGFFEDMEEFSPYETILHDTVPVYFYEDYHTQYAELLYDVRVAGENGNKLQIYEKGGKTTVIRDKITYSGSTFFTDENSGNQDVTKVRFLYSTSIAGSDNKYVTTTSALGKIIVKKDDGKYYYTAYDGTDVVIDNRYVVSETSYAYAANGDVTATTVTTYIYYLGIKPIMYYEGGEEYYFFDRNKAVLAADNASYVFIDLKLKRDFLFEYDSNSIAVTDAAKTQYSPRINGSFMGEIRRYVLTITSPFAVDRGDVKSLGNTTYYCDEDRDNVVAIYDKDGIKISEEAVPIPLFVFEPCESLPERADVRVAVKGLTEAYSQTCRFVIDPSSITLKGDMVVTEVIIAEGTMGERVYPVRIIINNREIVSEVTGGTSVYVDDNDVLSENVPVVDSIEIDPYDFVLEKYEYFLDTNNYNPNNYSMAKYLEEYALKERDFVNKFFKDYQFTIVFDYETSRLVALNVKDEYVQKEYSNVKYVTVGDKVTASLTEFNWELDRFDGATNNIEENISPLGSTIFLHTHFYGQLIALRVYVGTRTLAYLKFGETDSFNTVNDVGSVDPNGHYSANYFDSDSYTVNTHPIFVFKDERGRLYERVFDMDYIYDTDSNGNYLIKSYGTGWADPVITNIGSNGSYYTDKDGNTVNRPFFISNVVRDENGFVVSEDYPTPTANDSDITTATLDLRYILAIYKNNDGEKVRLNMISGDSNSEWFATVVLRVKVECPNQDVDVVRLSDSGLSSTDAVEEIDDVNNGDVFTPSAVKIGSNPVGYFQVDPLNSDTLIIPTSATLYFVDKDGNRVPTGHVFKNIKWENVPEAAAEIVVYDSATNTYRFNLSTAMPLTTRIQAKIGNDISGYRTIVLSLKVLSKDPKNIEFYSSATDEAHHIDGIEKLSLSVDTGRAETDNFIEYRYYVDTFANFAVPQYVRATFGTTGNSREVDYAVKWRLATDNKEAVYSPDTVACLKTTIGDTAEVSVDIYLTVVVANYSLSSVEMLNGYLNYYVAVKDKATGEYGYKKLSELYVQTLAENAVGYGSEDGDRISVSLGRADDNGVPVGKVGLFNDVGGVKVLFTSVYPYDLVKTLYSNAHIVFNDVENVDIWGGINDDYYNSYVYLESGLPAKLSEAASVVFGYDASTAMFTAQVVFAKEGDYAVVDGDDTVAVYPNSFMSASDIKKVGVKELGMLVSQMVCAEPLDELTAVSVQTEGGGTVAFNCKVKDMYRYSNGTVTFVNPDSGDETLFRTIRLSDGKVLTYEEFGYRIIFLNKHRATGYAPATIRNKNISVNNLDGLFNVNDMVVNTQDSASVFTDKYRVILGTGNGSYDLIANVYFCDGVRASAESSGLKEVTVNAYSNAGTAQYGESGYVLGDTMSAQVVAVKQDGTGDTLNYDYGGLKASLTDWYVEQSDYDEIKVGTFISVIPQTVIYANNDGTLRLSTRTVEGFRLVRVFHFNGVSDNISTFTSVGNTTLAIQNGTIKVTNLYDFVQEKSTKYTVQLTDPATGEPTGEYATYTYYYNDLASYFGMVSNLPKTIELNTGSQTIRVTNVPWNLDTDWYYTTTEASGRPVENGVLANMDYNGTYNTGTKQNDSKVIATAEILGWTSIEDGKAVSHDKVSIKLYINIDSAEAVSLPWKEASPYLDSTVINETVTAAGSEIQRKVFVVDVDAYNNSTSGAINGSLFRMPADLKVKYAGGLINVFNGVTYKYLNEPIAAVPYNIYGIDTAALAEQMGVAESSLSKSSIDLTVDLGLGQELLLRFRFFDKTVQSILPYVPLNDATVRAQIASSFDANGYSDDLMSLFNRTRITYNLSKLVSDVDLFNNTAVFADARSLYGKTDADIRASFIAAINVLDNGYGGAFPETTGFTDEQAARYVYNRLAAVFNSAYATYGPQLKTVLDNIPAEDATEEERKQKTSTYEDADAVIREFTEALFDNAYKQVINDYVGGETARVIKADLTAHTNSELNYAFDVKNAIESNFDIENAIKEISVLREQLAFGNIPDENACIAKIKETLIKYVNTAVSKAKAACPQAAAYAYSARLIDVFLVRMGCKSIENYDFSEVNMYNVNYFAENYALTETKPSMRLKLRETIDKCMDFGYNYADVIDGAIANNYANTANIESSVLLIKNNVLSGISIDSAVNSMLEKVVKNYSAKVYTEMRVCIAAKKAQQLNTTGNMYVIDAYGDYLYVPTKYVADFDESSGGYSYSFNINWANDTVSNNVNYLGNVKEDYVAYVGLAKRYESDVATAEDVRPKDYMEGQLANERALVEGKSWSEVKAENVALYNTMEGIYNLVTSYYTIPAGASDEEKKALAETYAIELYCYYKVGITLYNAGDGIYAVNGLDRATVNKYYESYKYTELNAVLHLSTTGDDQDISLIVKVPNRAVDPGDVQLYKMEDGARKEYSSFAVTDPFMTTVNDLPDRVDIDGVTYRVLWSDVTISPSGNLSVNDKTVYGYIKSAKGQKVALRLVVWSYEYLGMYKLRYIASKDAYEWGLMNPIDVYTSKYSTNSSENYYQLSFKVTKDDKSTFIARLDFYPQDSAYLENSPDDSYMATVAQYMKYVIYWDEDALRSAKNGVSVTNGSLSVGNEVMGRYDLSTLAGSGTTAVSKANYYNEKVNVDGLKLIFGLDESNDLYGDVEDGLYGSKNQSAVIVDIDKAAQIAANPDYVAYALTVSQYYTDVLNKRAEGDAGKTYVNGIVADKRNGIPKVSGKPDWDALVAANPMLEDMFDRFYAMAEDKYKDMAETTSEEVAAKAAAVKEYAMLLYTYDLTGRDLLTSDSETLAGKNIDKNALISLYDGARSAVAVISSELPMTGEVRFYENYVHYDVSEITTRLLWNKSYDRALRDLVAFVKYGKDLSNAEAQEQALAILFNCNRSAKEESKLVSEAKTYLAYYNNVKGEDLAAYLASEQSTLDAYGLLMIHEKYDYTANGNSLKGGIDATAKVTMAIKFGTGTEIFTKSYAVKLIFVDYTPIEYSVANIRETTETIDEMYIDVRSEYWSREDGTTGYEADGKTSRYDTTDAFIYKLLQIYADGEAKSADGTIRILVTDVRFGATVNGYKESVSFRINGAEYHSNLITLPVVG